MKVLYWSERFWPHIGGVETLSAQLLPMLVDKGHQFTLVTSHNQEQLPDREDWHNTPLHRFHFLTALTNNNLPQLIQARRRLSELKTTFQPDLVHIHFSGPSSWFHWQTYSKWPSPTLITIHSLPQRLRQKKSLLVETLQRATWVNTVSAYMLADLRQLVPAITPRSSVIYNGVSMAHHLPATSVMDATGYLLCIGRLVTWKGFDVALRALTLLVERWPHLNLMIVGDGPARPMLEALCEELGLGERVTFVGWVVPEALPNWLANSTVVLIPSRADENLPMVAIEAGLQACPVIANNVSGLPEIIEDGVTGYLCPPNDADYLAARITDLLTDPERKVKMGKAAQAKVIAQFSLDDCAAHYDRLYKQLWDEF